MNPALAIVEARSALTRRFEHETEALGRKGFGGRTLVSARELKEALAMRDAGRSDDEVEKALRLQSGFLAKLPERVVANV